MITDKNSSVRFAEVLYRLGRIALSVGVGIPLVKLLLIANLLFNAGKPFEEAFPQIAFMGGWPLAFVSVVGVLLYFIFRAFYYIRVGEWMEHPRWFFTVFISTVAVYSLLYPAWILW